jgi:hypothetical protein
MIFKDSDGYKYLKGKNKGKDIPFCLWDNLNPFYPNQKTDFMNCITGRKQITTNELTYIFNLAELVYKNKQQMNRLRDNQKPQPQPDKCEIL